MGKCKLHLEWLDRRDENGYVIKEWGRRHSDDEVFCLLCNVTFNISAKGFQAISQHASTARHKKFCKTNLHKNQLRLAAVRPTCSASASTTVCADIVPIAAEKTLQVYSVCDSFTAAEIFWVLKCIASNYSFSSCDGIGELFDCMFSNNCSSKILSNFTLSSTKARYLLTDALSPYFQKLLLDDLMGAYYSICYDETTNNASKKELQIAVRYWSEKKNQIVCQHLQTYFIGSATAEVIMEKINAALDSASLPRQKFVMLGSDGPNVNKRTVRLINEELMSIRKKSLLDIGTCNIHILHTAFLNGLSVLGESASDLVIAVHDFFSGWPARWEDYTVIQTEQNLPYHSFFKHVSSRWLTLEGATARLIEQWDAVNKYYLSFVPKKKSDLTKSAKYKRIVELLKKPTMKAELLFVISSARLFTRFTGIFQKEEPMIHVMFDEINTLTKTLMTKVCKPDSIRELGVCETVLQPENLLPVREVQVSDDVFAELSKMSNIDMLPFLSMVQKHFVKACSHILAKSSLKSKPLLKNFRFLQPKERVSLRSSSDIVAVAKALPMDIDTDILRDEWKLLQQETLSINCNRIDDYWGQIFALENSLNGPKYPHVFAVVKAALCLPHGNADVERGFSVSCNFLSEEKGSMSERTLNAAMIVKSGLQMFNMKPQFIVMTKELLAMARNAHATYQAHLERKKKELEENEKLKVEAEKKRIAEELKMTNLTKERKKISADEEKFKTLKREEEQTRQAADKLFLEANSRLKKAVSQKNMSEILLAQALLEGVINVKKEETEKKQMREAIQHSVEKRKSKIICDYFSKKPKI